MKAKQTKKIFSDEGKQMQQQTKAEILKVLQAEGK